jgi:hypothetical protein
MKKSTIVLSLLGIYAVGYGVYAADQKKKVVTTRKGKQLRRPKGMSDAAWQAVRQGQGRA